MEFSTTRSQAILNSLGTDLESGSLIFLTAGDVEVATVTLASTNIFSDITAKTATLNTVTADSSPTGGLAAKYEFRRSDNTLEWSGTVSATGGGGEIELSVQDVPAGIPFDMSSQNPYTITLP